MINNRVVVTLYDYLLDVPDYVIVNVGIKFDALIRSIFRFVMINENLSPNEIVDEISNIASFSDLDKKVFKEIIGGDKNKQQ